MRLLVTRPEPDNERTADALRAKGHDVVLAPLLRIEAILDADFGAPPWAAVVLTSANGARAISRHPLRSELAKLPTLTVGRSTADAARATGFGNVISAEGDARDLARLANARFAGAPAPLLYLAGEDRSGELRVPGCAVRSVVVYRAAKAERFPDLARDELLRGTIDGVLHFSRRSVEGFIECSRDLGERALAPTHYCLSARAAEPLQRAGAKRVVVAVHPDEASLLALIRP